MHFLITSTTLLSLLLPLAAALEILSPTSGTILTPNNFTVTWQRNSSIDPAHINIDLTKNSDSGLQSRTIGTNITVTDGSYTITPVQFNALSDISNGGGWQLNINSVPSEGNSFVTQSEDFTIEGAGGNPTTIVTAPISVSSTSISLDASESSLVATYTVNSSAFGATGSGTTTSSGTTTVVVVSSSSGAGGSSSSPTGDGTTHLPAMTVTVTSSSSSSGSAAVGSGTSTTASSTVAVSTGAAALGAKFGIGAIGAAVFGFLL